MWNTVSIEALIKRINRRLKETDEELKTTRGWHAKLQLGTYYIRNFARNWIVNHDVDPETVGRELGVLRSWEKVLEED